jgi:hypothetical protein
MIAHNPFHGSGRAALPHPALALGDDAHAAQGMAQGIRMAAHDSGPMGSLLHIRMTFAFTTPRRFNRRTGEKS